MKKRIFSALICAVIAALSILTAFSGCTGTSYPKVVADRDEFFSKIAGRYGNSDFNMYVFEDGTFHANLCLYYWDYSYDSIGIYNFNGSFKTVYQDSEFIYHTEMSKQNKSLKVSLFTDVEPKFEYGKNINYMESNVNRTGFISNDIIYILAPGTPVSEIPISDVNPDYFKVRSDDIDDDGNLNKYIFVNYRKSMLLSDYTEKNYISNGVWVDYNLSNLTIDTYSFENSYNIEVTTYDLSGNKLSQLEDSSDKPNPVYYITSYNNVIVFYDNGKANVICPTDDINKMKYYTEATDSTSKSLHKLIHYDKLPDYNTVIKEKAGNQ